MRISLANILLTCLLLAVTGVYGNTAKPGSFVVSVNHQQAASGFSHSSLDTDSELELSITHSGTSSSQQVSIKKLSSFTSVENTLSAAFAQNNLFSFITATTGIRSVHLLLIFPFHYFW